MRPLSLSQASSIVDAALAKRRQLGFQPLTAAVLDQGGSPLACKREDGSGNLHPQIAPAKAWGALGMGGRALAARADAAPAFFAALSAISDGWIIPVLGGVLIRDDEGPVLGEQDAHG
jgi:uncharacterized protein GlcG (DUF336 family)